MLKIGVFARPDLSCGGNRVWQINQQITEIIVQNGAQVIALIPPVTDYQQPMKVDEFHLMMQQIDDCDGIILQGGDEYYDYDMEAVRYLHHVDKPTLGICLGMQSMAMAFSGAITKLQPFHIEHFQKEVPYVHLVTLSKKSQLAHLLGTNCLKVNSRHHEAITKTNLNIVALSSDDVIEAIEDASKTFFIGVQWHPESMIEYDKVSKKLFTEFFNSVRRKYENRGSNQNC